MNENMLSEVVLQEKEHEKMSRDYKKFIVAYFFSTIADVLYIVVSTTFIYFLTDSLTLASIPIVLAMIAYSLGSLLTNKVILLYPNIKALYLISTIIILVLTLLFLLNLIFLTDSLVFYYCLVFLIPIFRGVNAALNFPIIPLIEKNEVKGNSILAVVRNLVNLIGWGIGGALVSWIGEVKVMVIVIFLILCSVISFSIINSNILNKENNPDGEDPVKLKKISDIFTPLTNIFKNKTLRMVFTSEFFFLLGGGIWTGTILLAYVIEVLEKNETWWGYLVATYMVGATIGGFIVLRVNKFVKKHLVSLMFASGIVFCAVTVLFTINHTFFLAATLFLIFGIPANLKEVSQVSIMQNEGVGSTSKRVEIFSVYNVMDSLIHGLSIMILSNIADFFSVQHSFLVALGFYILATIIILNYLIRPKDGKLQKGTKMVEYSKKSW
ncbi:MFS transporter [Pseudalkalibacillus sp. R45]|uniref:MFS transporter n=1 Tax=Pseudalkalibacillus sp. R45 TaxID=3457433 RepID=UPI003FCC4FD3